MDQKKEQGRKLSLKEMVGTGGREPLRKLVNDKMKSKTQMEPSVRFLTHDDGFYGAFYEPETSAFPGKAMVICSGNEGSFFHAQAVAEKFCLEGMPALALGYWNTEGTPEDACMIPVEYMQSACRWLIRQKGLQPGVSGSGICPALCQPAAEDRLCHCCQSCPYPGQFPQLQKSCAFDGQSSFHV